MQTLLLTGSIAPYDIISKSGYKSTSLDPDQRLTEYINSIVYYISQSDFSHIVFCDNSNFIIPKHHRELIDNLCVYYRKHIELISFTSNHDMIVKKGYNYGEGECIDYAFDHSKFLKESDSRYKITGRYKYRNINEILEERKDCKFYFYRFSFPFLYGVVSEIFKCDNHTYKKFLYNIKELVDNKAPDFLRSYEMMCYYKLRPLLSKSKLPPIKTLPISHLWTQHHRHTNRNILFQISVNRFFLSKHLLHRGGMLDKLYNLFFGIYSKYKLKF